MRHQIHYGKKFYLDKTTGYWISTLCPKVRAHVFVWKYHKGRVLKGFHIHHIDKNRSNNSIENLKMVSASEHIRLHMSEERLIAAREHADKIRPLTKKWHASKEGREWHSLHGIECAKNFKSSVISCKHCAGKFSTGSYHDLFCSNVCKSAWRRARGIDDVKRFCSVCGKVFTINKYAKNRACGRSCGAKLRWQLRKNTID